PCFDLSATSFPQFSFWYHMLGTNMGELHLDLTTDGITWINDIVPPIIGNQGNSWLEQSADLTPYAGQNVQLRIRGITGDDFESDMAVDDIKLAEFAGNPSANFDADKTVLCPIQTAQFTDLTIPIANNRVWSFTPNTVTYLNGTDSTSLNPVIQFNSVGTYDVSLIINWVNGIDTVFQSSFINVTASLPLPQIEDFENEALCGTANNCETEVCSLSGNWINLENQVEDAIDWRVDEGGTASNNTGPSVDHTVGTSDGNYLYLEASGGCTGETAILESACIELPPSGNPSLSFWYHMLGNDMGSLHVDLFDGAVWIEDFMPPIVGDQGNQWQEVIVPIDSFNGQSIQLRIRGITGNGWSSDIAIDDIRVFNFSSPPVTDFDATPLTTCPGVEINFSDLSSSAPSAWAWSFSPNNVTYLSGTTDSSQNPVVSFNTVGNYSVTLITSNGNGNDTLTKTNFITIDNGATLPFAEDFQSGQFPPANWILDNPDAGISWVNTSVTGSDGQLTNVAWLNNFDYNEPGELDALQSYAIDLDATATGASLNFDVAYAQFNNNFSDRLFVEVSDDCGDTFAN
ncbi:MAG: PKD domain-containing protein, partial [Bacteroidota bacterium]